MYVKEKEWEREMYTFHWIIFQVEALINFNSIILLKYQEHYNSSLPFF